jgi:hypothetical protein
MKEVKYTILYCVCENYSDTIISRFWLRFRTLNNYDSASGSATAKSYGSFGFGSTTLSTKCLTLGDLLYRTIRGLIVVMRENIASNEQKKGP